MLSNWIFQRVKSLQKQIVENKNLDRNFRVGDTILYPHHGIGKITTLKSFKDMGDFYVVEMGASKMRIMVPIHKMHTVGASLLKSIPEGK